MEQGRPLRMYRVMVQRNEPRMSEDYKPCAAMTARGEYRETGPHLKI